MPGSDSPRHSRTDSLGVGEPSGGDAAERFAQRRARAIETFQSALREMIRAEDEEAVCGIIVESAKRVLDLPIAAVWLLDETETRLEPVAWCDEAASLFDGLPTYEAGDGLSWEAYETGEQIVVDDMADVDEAINPDTPIRSELVVPIGDRGVLNCGSTTVEHFGEDDVALADLLAENAAVALERAVHERRLQRQADQLEYFNSLLRHEVLNGMTIIRSRGMRIFDSTTGSPSEQASTIVSWCDEIVEVVRRVRSVLDTMTGRDRTLEPVDAATVATRTVDRVAETFPDPTYEVDTPMAATVAADGLLSDVLSAVVRNAVEHNDPGDLRVRVTVEERDGQVRISVADDGVGIPPEDRETVFRREGAGHAKEIGSGFGLFFVDAMVRSYGGSVWATGNEDGGTTIVLELREPTDDER